MALITEADNITQSVENPERLTFKNLALPMAALNIPTIRLQPKSKLPMDKAWPSLATTSIDTILAQNSETPYAGCACVAKPDGVCFLEVDEPGVVERYEQETGEKFPEPTVQSRPGRLHYYLLQTDETRACGNVSQKELVWGSFRQRDQYVVAAGSTHAVTGEPYQLLSSTIAPAPKRLIEWLTAQRTKSTEIKANQNLMGNDPISLGQHDVTLFAIACTLREKGLEYDEMLPVVMRHAERCVSRGSDWVDMVKNKCRSACHYPAGNPTPTVLIGGKLPGEAVVVQSKHSQQQPNVEIIPAGKFKKNPVKVKKSLAEYPLWVWEGTIFEEIAEACGKGNFIPREFALEAIKTITGSICGHRIQPQGARGQQPSRWYSILIGPGGIGKSTVVNWLLDMFLGTGLLCEVSQEIGFVNIGCAKGSFASDSGMKKNGFAKHARILQVYDEISILIEKFSITGSGGSFLDTINQMFEYCPVYPQMSTKDDKLTNMPSREAHNSILGCTTPLRWQNAFGKTNTEQSGFFQRLNIITNASGERVSELHPPDLSDLRDRLVRKIQPLEFQMAEVVKTPEAIALQEEWHKAKRKEWENLPDDIKGRIETLLLRNISQISWLMSGEDVLPDASKSDQPLELVCDEDIIRRAIALAEYEIHARQFHRPIPGDNPYALLENSIERYFQENGGQDVNRSKLYRDLHAERHGELIYTKVLDGLVQRGTIKIGQREGDTRRGRKALVVMWLGEENEEE